MLKETKPKLPTIRDVARRANVSTATVSHVINNTRFVSEETRARVLEAIRELGFYPNALARSLTTKRTATIGVLISDVSNVFFAEIIRGVESVLTGAGYNLILCNTDEDPAREQQYLELLLNKRIDGLIAAATSGPWEQLRDFEVLDIPIVYVDRVFPGIRGTAITVDNTDGAYRGVLHLVQDGHRAIGILAGLLRMSTMSERLAGYQRALRECGLALDQRLVVPSALSIEAGRQSALTLLARDTRPAALFCSNNLLGLGALRALRQLGLRCPDDVGILMFDDHPWAGVANPPLSVVRQPTYDLGRLAAEHLLKLIGGTPSETRTVVLRPELIIRQSCARHELSELQAAQSGGLPQA